MLHRFFAMLLFFGLLIFGQQKALATSLELDGLWVSDQCSQKLESRGSRLTFLISKGHLIRTENIFYIDFPSCGFESERRTVKSDQLIEKTDDRVKIGEQEFLFDFENKKLKNSQIDQMSLVAAPHDQRTPVVTDSCPNLSGIWQNNNFYFHFTQEGCVRFAQNSEGVPPYFATFDDLEMFPDHLIWDRFENGYTQSQGHFTGDSFLFDYNLKLRDGTILKRHQKFYLTHKPCGTSFSKKEFLVIELYDRDAAELISCDYYGKWSNAK